MPIKNTPLVNIIENALKRCGIFTNYDKDDVPWKKIIIVQNAAPSLNVCLAAVPKVIFVIPAKN